MFTVLGFGYFCSFHFFNKGRLAQQENHSINPKQAIPEPPTHTEEGNNFSTFLLPSPLQLLFGLALLVTSALPFPQMEAVSGRQRFYLQ